MVPALPGLSGRPGCVRSKAWICDFSSTDSTDRMTRRSHVQADNVLELGQELRIAAALEGAQPVRLQIMRRPDALHGAQGQARGLGHRPASPVRGRARRLAAGQRHHPLHHGSGVGALPGLRVLSCKRPSMPASAKRNCQRHTAGRLIPARRATSATSSRSAECRIIRARAACFCGRLRSATIAASRARSSAEDQRTNHVRHARTRSTAQHICESTECVSALACQDESDELALGTGRRHFVPVAQPHRAPRLHYGGLDAVLNEIALPDFAPPR